MPEGGCLCGKVRIQFDGEPKMKALCHCGDCKKITGSTYSTNVVIPGDTFKVTSGTPKEYKKTAESGNEIVSYFCGDCGTTLYRDGKSFGDNKVVKVGVVDGSYLEDAKPVAELFAKDRVSWVGEHDGAKQVNGMS